MNRPARQNWGRFLTKAFVLGLAIVLTLAYLTDRYRIGRDAQSVRSLGEYTTFLVDRHRQSLEPGQVVAFRAKGLGPYFEDGTLMAKRIVGVPGDRVQVRPSGEKAGVWINGERMVDGFMHQQDLGLSDAQMARNERVPEGAFFVLGDVPESYDSRYWGYASAEQMVGDVHILH